MSAEVPKRLSVKLTFLYSPLTQSCKIKMRVRLFIGY
jgi:hypothetical protein